VCSKHCNYSARVNWVEGGKRSIGSSNQEVFKESGRHNQSSFYICYVIIPIGKPVNIIQTTPKIPSQTMSIEQQSF
jgi:hypothetical protein